MATGGPERVCALKTDGVWRLFVALMMAVVNYTVWPTVYSGRGILPETEKYAERSKNVEFSNPCFLGCHLPWYHQRGSRNGVSV